MRYYRCRCGLNACWSSMMPFPCDICVACGSDFATAPDLHMEPQPHRFIVTKVETDAGDAELSRCQWCCRTKKELEISS